MDGNTTSIYHTGTIDVGACAANAVTETAVTVPGAAVGDVPIVSNRAALAAGLSIVPGRVSAANTVQLCIANLTAAPIDPAAQTFDIVIIRATGNRS